MEKKVGRDEIPLKLQSRVGCQRDGSTLRDSSGISAKKDDFTNSYEDRGDSNSFPNCCKLCCTFANLHYMMQIIVSRENAVYVGGGSRGVLHCRFDVGAKWLLTTGYKLVDKVGLEGRQPPFPRSSKQLMSLDSGAVFFETHELHHDKQKQNLLSTQHTCQVSRCLSASETVHIDL